MTRPRLVTGRALPLARYLSVLVAGALVAGAIWWVGRDLADRISAPPVVRLTPVVPGSRTRAEPIDFLVAIDESGSTDQSDPHRYRHSEAALTARWLAAGSGNSHDAIAVAHFTDVVDASAPAEVGDGVGPIVSAIEDDRTSGAGTDIAKAYTWADGVCDAHPDRWNIVVLFTDGQDEESRVAPAAAASTCDAVYLVALDADGAFEAIEPFWRSLPLAGIRRLDQVSAGTVAASLGQIVLDETGAKVPDGSPLVTVH